jgi:hypothetical protein
MKNLALSFTITLLAASIFSYMQVSYGQTPLFRGTLISVVLVTVLAVIVFVLSFFVSDYKNGKETNLSAQNAYQILCIANASIFSGTILISIWGGTLLGEFEIWAILGNKMLFEILSISAAVLLIIAGIITRSRCKLDTDSEDSSAPMIPLQKPPIPSCNS